MQNTPAATNKRNGEGALSDHAAIRKAAGLPVSADTPVVAFSPVVLPIPGRAGVLLAAPGDGGADLTEFGQSLTFFRNASQGGWSFGPARFSRPGFFGACLSPWRD